MSSFAHPYARAFLESAPAGYDFASFLDAGGSLAGTIAGSSTLRAFLLAPNVPREAKSQAVAELAGKSGIDAFGARFLEVLLAHRRLLDVGQVLTALRDLNDEQQGVLRVRVTVPGPLDGDESKALEEAIARRTGKKVRMQIDFDEALLGGFIARAGSNVFDGSVAAAIRRFQTQVKERTGA